jgi:hypothetical protein
VHVAHGAHVAHVAHDAHAAPRVVLRRMLRGMLRTQSLETS